MIPYVFVVLLTMPTFGGEVRGEVQVTSLGSCEALRAEVQGELKHHRLRLGPCQEGSAQIPVGRWAFEVTAPSDTYGTLRFVIAAVDAPSCEKLRFVARLKTKDSLGVSVGACSTPQ